MPFVKGDPRINRKGRPTKGQTMTKLLEEYGERPHNNRELSDKLELIASLWERAIAGDDNAAKYIIDRIDGKPTEKVEVSGDENKPLGVVFLPIQITPEEWMKNAENRKGVEPTTKAEDSS